MKDTIRDNCRNILEEKLGSYVEGVTPEHIYSFLSKIIVHKILFKNVDNKSQLHNALEDLWNIATNPKFNDKDISALFRLPEISMYEYKKTYTQMDEMYFRKYLADLIATDSKQNIYSKSIHQKLMSTANELGPIGSQKRLSSEIEKYLSDRIASIADNVIPKIKTTKDPRIIELYYGKPITDSRQGINKIQQDLFSTILARDPKSGRYIAFRYRNWKIDKTQSRETDQHVIYTVTFKDNITEEKICHMQIWYAILKTVFVDKSKKDLEKIIVKENRKLINLMSEENLSEKKSFNEWGEKVLDNAKTFEKISPPSKKDKEYKHKIHQILNYLFKHVDDLTHATIKTLPKEDKTSPETLNTIGKIIWLACINSIDMETLASSSQCRHGFTKHLSENTNICHVVKNKKISKYAAKEYNKFLDNLPDRIGLAAKTSIQFESLMQGTLTSEKPANALPA